MPRERQESLLAYEAVRLREDHERMKELFEAATKVVAKMLSSMFGAKGKT